MASYTTINGLLHVETAAGVYAPATVPLIVQGGFLVRLTDDQLAALTPPPFPSFPLNYPLPLEQVNALRSLTSLPPVTLASGQSIQAIVDWGSSSITNPGTGLYGWMGGLLSRLDTLLTRLPSSLEGDRLKVDVVGTVSGGGGGGGGGASDTLLTEIRDRLPGALEAGRLKAAVTGTVGISGTVDLGSLNGAATAQLQRYTPVAIGSVTTSTTGTDWVSLGDYPGRYVDFQNTSSVELEYRRGGAGHSMRIPARSGRIIPLLANANEISIRRVDTQGTPVTCNYEVVA